MAEKSDECGGAPPSPFQKSEQTIILAPDGEVNLFVVPECVSDLWKVDDLIRQRESRRRREGLRRGASGHTTRAQWAYPKSDEHILSILCCLFRCVPCLLTLDLGKRATK